MDQAKIDHQPTAIELDRGGDAIDRPSLLLCMVLTAMAGGMGWGIRGQYGHETGAMIAGVLVGLVLVFLFCYRTTSLTAARAVALCALGISLGGSMTYGQTVGLTHDAELIGNFDALRWGLLGLFLKGGIWIAFAAALLGMGLSHRKYGPLEVALLLVTMVFLLFLGVYLLNTPFDPGHRSLPRFYFSDAWYWEPDGDLTPRRERWGGLLAALIGLVIYVRAFRSDRLAFRLALWGFVAGGIGFSFGQCLQAFHAWNVEAFRESWFAEMDSHINWWNMMETTFGAVFGAILALGLWLNRHLIGVDRKPDAVGLNLSTEWLLVVVHVGALTAWNFVSFSFFGDFADLAITMAIIPLVAVVAGRGWPYLMILPITALPIAGKTLRQLSFQEHQLPVTAGVFLYVILPLCITTAAALAFSRHATKPDSARPFTRWALLLCTWLYFGLNFAFFRFPWPWQDWTNRTPNGLIFFVCAVSLTVASFGWRHSDGSRATSV